MPNNQMEGKMSSYDEIEKYVSIVRDTFPNYNPNITRGIRHKYLVQTATFLKTHGKNEEFIKEALLIINSTECDPPMSDADIAKIAKWVCGKKVT